MEDKQKKKWKKIAGTSLGLYGAGLVIFIGLLYGASLYQPNQVPDEESGFTQFIGEVTSAQFSGELVPATAPTLGPDDAKITIVEFSDFGCPFCKASFPVIRQILSQYPDDVRLVYRHFPVDSLHPDASELAHASMCAHEQDAFWAFHDRLFQLQETSSLDELDSIAQSVGLDVRKFRRCQDSRTYEDLVQQDLRDALGLGARGTPTWIINGELVQGSLPLSLWQQIIEELL